ncbi:MAG: hypothetical protein K2Q18_07465 [Bdellovibrionales bacterium]|nr:hypothetical protein [Bdellovibrionales bacterium]
MLLFFVSGNLWSQTINLGRFSIAESRVKINLEDFKAEYKKDFIRTKWEPKSVQWIRNESNLLIPRALLKIFVKKEEASVYLKYQEKAIFPVHKKEWVESEFYVDLFHPETIYVYDGKTLLDQIVISTKNIKSDQSKKLIDYSCSPFNIKIEGVDDEYLSLGCKMTRVGSLGSETPRLEITVSSTNLHTLNLEKPPFSIYMEDSSPVEMKLLGKNEEVKTLSLTANVPKRVHRLTTAFGLGPYVYESQEKSVRIDSTIAPSVMIYAKYDLTETASIKAFDALLYSTSFFNNSGLYFSYDLASALDGRVILNALLGFQGLHFKHSENYATKFRVIYPQGFEVIYKHAFIDNYTLTYGMFLSTNSESYTNAWARYGKKAFLELNYIKWGHESSQIKMWGLSVGIPFFSLF